MSNDEKLARQISDNLRAITINGLKSFTWRTTRTFRDSVELGTQIRDEWLDQYSILPGAVTTFVDVATSREWLVAGTPRAASRAVKIMHSSHFQDDSGINHSGWEQMMERLCRDWLTFGRCMFHYNGDTPGPMYIDPAHITIQQKSDRAQVNWLYKGRVPKDIPQTEMFFLDDVRRGRSGGFMGRVAWLLPIANLDWLLRLHDTMQLDGRKIRDIFVVPDGVTDSLKEGLEIAAALASGEDPAKNGIPVIEIDSIGYDGPLSDLFHRIGLSEVPREFSRQEFESRYAREISATLGLPIGQFWHDPRGTNRSLEQVQQERATLKGPSYFVRSLARVINQSEMLGKTPSNKAIMIFDEETDNTSLKLNAEALKMYAEAIAVVREIANNDSEEGKDTMKWLGFLEQKGLIPSNATLPDVVTREEMTLRGTSIDDIMDKGWVIMDANEKVVEKRFDALEPVG